MDQKPRQTKIKVLCTTYCELCTEVCRRWCPEPEFIIIYWWLESRLFATSCLFKGQRVQQGSYRLQFLLNDIKTLFYSNFNRLEKWLKSYNYSKSFIIKNIIKLIWNPGLALSAELHFKMFKNSGSVRSAKRFHHRILGLLSCLFEARSYKLYMQPLPCRTGTAVEVYSPSISQALASNRLKIFSQNTMMASLSW